MAANLTPQYLEAERVFKEAKTANEKLAALEEMLRLVPKHKGTEKIQGDIKRRISKTKRESQKQSGAKRASHRIPREGAGQVVLVGAPNVGKSSLLRGFTHATPEVAAYPLTTHHPTPGMMTFEDTQVQLIDLPPLNEDHVEPWVFDIIRAADLFLFVADLTAIDPLGQVELACEMLEAKHIVAYGTTPVTPPIGGVAKPALVIGAKLDGDKAEDNAAFLEEYFAERFPCLHVSVEARQNLDVFRRTVFDALNVLRVYTKIPGKKSARDAPYVVPRGATVLDLAALVHKDMAARLKFARIWGANKFDGQKVNREYTLEDGDLLELHIG